jgi:hypothetical protein
MTNLIHGDTYYPEGAVHDDAVAIDTLAAFFEPVKLLL